MTDQPVPAVPDAPPPVPDDIGARLQARLDTLEHSSELLRPRIPREQDRLPALVRDEPPVTDPAAGVADLNAQLDVLRHQLETAFEEMDAHLDGLRADADAATARAAEADSRAQVASARAANVLAAVDALTEELTRLAPTLDTPQNQRLRAAVDRLRTRLQSA